MLFPGEGVRGCCSTVHLFYHVVCGFRSRVVVLVEEVVEGHGFY